MGRINHYLSFAAVLTLTATLAFPAQRAIGEELPANIVAASDAATSADQRLVYMLIHQYDDTNCKVSSFSLDKQVFIDSTRGSAFLQNEILEFP